MGASFEEKVEALRKLRDKQLAKRAAASGTEAEQSISAPTEPQEQRQDAPIKDESAPLPDARESEGTRPGHSSVEDQGPGDADAFFCTAHCHERGLHGCEMNLEMAEQLYRLAAEKGHTVAQWRLGELLESGLNGLVPKDAKQAKRWYTLAAESGNVEAQSALALMLEDGAEGVDPDPAAALSWHLRAAEKGNAVSQYCAACSLSSNGDAEEAHLWLQQSAAQGFRPAIQVLEESQLRPAAAEHHDPQGLTPDGVEAGDLVRLAARVAQQLKGLQDDEAEHLLGELLDECPSLLDPGLGSGLPAPSPNE